MNNNFELNKINIEINILKNENTSIAIVSSTETRFIKLGSSEIDIYNLYEIASLSKSITAMGVLLLIKKGLLCLENNMSEYFPNLNIFYKRKIVTKDIKIKNLLNHTSGFRKYCMFFHGNGTYDYLIQKLNNNKLKYFPGTCYEYCSINYDILACIIEKITKQSFQEYITNNILRPLGLNNTFLVSNNSDLSKFNIYCGYKLLFGHMIKKNYSIRNSNIASGYILSCINDMARWMKIQLNMQNDIPNIFKELIEESHIMSSINDINSNVLFYSFGWIIKKRPYRIFHNGINPCFSSSIILMPDLKTGICVLSNINYNNESAVQICEDLDKNISKFINDINKNQVKVSTKLKSFDYIEIILLLITLANCFIFFSSLTWLNYIDLKKALFFINGILDLLMMVILFIFLRLKINFKILFEWLRESAKICIIVSVIITIVYLLNLIV